MAKKLPFSSPAPTGAIVSQFFLALEKCFDMLDGEVVYIEKDGDVSSNNPLNIENGEQIELKEYADDNSLTDSHLNFWNTLNNWTHKDFDSKKYKYLILATTQEIGVNSKFLKWNNSNYDGKLKILTDIYAEANTRYNKKLQADAKSKKPEPLQLMDEIFKSNLLEQVIDKIIIDCNRTRRDQISEEIKQKHLKAFPIGNLDQVLNLLIGYVFRNEEYNKGWEITCLKFKTELQDLSSRYNNNSQLFPIHDDLKNIPESEKEKRLKYTFIKKIEEIDYHEVIPNSLNEYWFALNTIIREFHGRTQKEKAIKALEDNLLNTHNTSYKIACRNSKISRLINDSQNFYDSITGSQAPNFDIYNDTPPIFKNGMYHILADENDKIIWKLNPKGDE
ncbi:MAG TPA: hypothetical protein VF465_20255 [Flavobacterium sp.]|uniref:hypothetical protein n=1 Tax=Flavobacterium sp. TaxID=239 RepID=UPI002ED31E31